MSKVNVCEWLGFLDSLAKANERTLTGSPRGETGESGVWDRLCEDLHHYDTFQGPDKKKKKKKKRKDEYYTDPPLLN